MPRDRSGAWPGQPLPQGHVREMRRGPATVAFLRGL